MRIPLSALIITLIFPAALVHGQAAASESQSAGQVAPPATSQTKSVQSQSGAPLAPATAAQGTAPAALVVPSSFLQPSLVLAQNTLASLKLDKWKKGSVREEAESNVSSLLHDLQANIPPLMSAADAAPGEVSKSIPLLKHMDAFYDVFLRVEEASRVSAPGDQINALQVALLDVNKARIALDDHLAEQAASQEKEVVSLQSDLRAEKDAEAREPKAEPVPAVQPCKPAAPAHRRKKTTTATKTTPPTTTQSATPAPKPQ